MTSEVDSHGKADATFRLAQVWLKTADRQRRPAQRQATRKRNGRPLCHRRSAASCPAATPLSTPSSATSLNLLLGVTSDIFNFQTPFRTPSARHGIRSCSRHGRTKPVESKTRTHNGRVGSARRTADGGAGRSWAEQGADISVGPEANHPSSPPGYRKQLF